MRINKVPIIIIIIIFFSCISEISSLNGQISFMPPGGLTPFYFTHCWEDEMSGFSNNSTSRLPWHEHIQVTKEACDLFFYTHTRDSMSHFWGFQLGISHDLVPKVISISEYFLIRVQHYVLTLYWSQWRQLSCISQNTLHCFFYWSCHPCWLRFNMTSVHAWSSANRFMRRLLWGSLSCDKSSFSLANKQTVRQ